MTQDPSGGQERPPDGGLPDYSGRDEQGLPDYESGRVGDTLGEPSPRSRNRTLAITMSVIGTAVVLLAIVALILSQTVFSSALEEDDPSAYPTDSRSAEGQSEYVPDPQDPDIAPPPPIFTQAPTTACSMPTDSGQAAAPTESGTIRGGDLQYTLPDGWDHPWYDDVLPYLTEVSGQGRHVEGNWYSVANLGRVTFPEDEGGYPGLEPAAVAIFQCYATTAGVTINFGESPEVTDYRSESITVDGHPAWIVQATYHFEDPETLESSSASVVTSIVVEGPNGPSAMASDVAADLPEHQKNLEDIIASLEVVE